MSKKVSEYRKIDLEIALRSAQSERAAATRTIVGAPPSLEQARLLPHLRGRVKK